MAPEIPRHSSSPIVSLKHGSSFLDAFQKSLSEESRSLQQTPGSHTHDERGGDPRGLFCEAEAARQQWLSFARSTGDFRLTGNRTFRSDLELIQTIEDEEASFLAFASSKELDGISLLAGLPQFKPLRTSGSEHLVYIKDNRAYKRTKSGVYGQKFATPDQYMERLALMNQICPPLDNRFEDFVKNSADRCSIISSMRFFPGPHPEGHIVDSYLKEAGFSVLSDGSGTMDYINHDFRLILRDCHPQNWIMDRDLIPIDIIPERIK